MDKNRNLIPVAPKKSSIKSHGRNKEWEGEKVRNKKERQKLSEA